MPKAPRNAATPAPTIGKSQDQKRDRTEHAAEHGARDVEIARRLVQSGTLKPEAHRDFLVGLLPILHFLQRVGDGFLAAALHFGRSTPESLRPRPPVTPSSRLSFWRSPEM